MKRMKINRSARFVVAGGLCALNVLTVAASSPRAEIGAVIEQAADKAEAKSATETDGKKKKIIIETVERDAEEGVAKEVARLGVSTEEASETVGAQLGLSPGAGLVVTYVAAEGPAAKAGVQKNDVLIQFDGQLLVHPSQLRKLVRMHKPGDSVKLEAYRAGK